MRLTCNTFFLIKTTRFMVSTFRTNETAPPCVVRDMKNSWTGGETGASPPDSAREALALSIHRQQEGALERLIKLFEAPLFNYSQRLLDNASDAQEVVQDTFLRAHRAITHQYDEARCAALALRPWLFSIARNLCFNRRRSRGATRLEPLEAFDDGRMGPFVQPVSSDLERREEMAQLDRALSQLPLEARELIVLRFIEEMSYAEISSTTGSNEASLRGKVFRSLKLLRSALETRGVAHAM
jgi:RNA polymerase sigma-70 factor (ECF subfamily)